VSYVTDSFDERVIDLLRSGAVGFMPSDTIYGLSCTALNESAVKKLHQLKDRARHKPFIVLISNIKMLDMLSIDKKQTEVAQKYWPGGLTLICNALDTPSWLQLGTQSLAVRIPDELSLLKLIDKVGPLISTSANKQGQEPLLSKDAAEKLFGNDLDFYIDAGQLPNALPSTIVRVANGKLQIIRQGAVKL
jgi:L-threonylcarbamoyladenylate synthase